MRELRARLGKALAIDVEVVDEIPRTRAGKQRLIVSSLSASQGSLTPRGGAEGPAQRE